MQLQARLIAAARLARSGAERGLLHPLWLGALALLLINDHLLKGAGLLPGWLTGKLSDFAGLIVAPPLLAAAIRARSPRARLACAAAVGATFALVKLVPPCARAIEGALAMVHVESRIWCDPTDLVALVVLPLAWSLGAGSTVALAAARRFARPLERAAVVAGAMACLATFDHWPEGGAVRTEGADVELVNHTRAPVSVALFRAAAGQLDCAALDSGDRSALGAAAFTAVESCIELDPVEAARIGQLVITSADADAGVPAVDAGSFPGCHAVAVRATGLADTVLFWDSLHFGFVLDPLDPASVYLEQAGSRLYLAGSPYIQAWTADFALPRSGCAGAP